MTTYTATTQLSKPKFWAATIISVLCSAFLLFDGIMKVAMVAPVKEAVVRLGYPESVTPATGILLIVCTLIYLIPRTSVLGAILLTGYLGGATVIHVRVGDPFYFPVIFGVLVWAGLFIRDERLQSLIPIRRQLHQ